jgi:hypothetical protein
MGVMRFRKSEPEVTEIDFFSDHPFRLLQIKFQIQVIDELGDPSGFDLHEGPGAFAKAKGEIAKRYVKTCKDFIRYLEADGRRSVIPMKWMTRIRPYLHVYPILDYMHMNRMPRPWETKDDGPNESLKIIEDKEIPYYEKEITHRWHEYPSGRRLMKKLREPFVGRYDPALFLFEAATDYKRLQYRIMEAGGSKDQLLSERTIRAYLKAMTGEKGDPEAVIWNCGQLGRRGPTIYAFGYWTEQKQQFFIQNTDYFKSWLKDFKIREDN